MVAVQYHDLDKIVVMAEHKQVDMRMVVMYATVSVWLLLLCMHAWRSGLSNDGLVVLGPPFQFTRRFRVPPCVGLRTGTFKIKKK